MTNEEKQIVLEEVFKQLEEFEKTIVALQGNIKSFRKTLEERKKKYGPDISKWPKAKD